MYWVPMKKNEDISISLSEVAKNLWTATLVGVTGLTLGYIYSPTWALVALPFLCSFIFGIPVTYLAGKRIKSVGIADDQRYLQVASDFKLKHGEFFPLKLGPIHPRVT